MSAVSIDYELLTMRPADLPDVLKNERRAYSHPWTEGIFTDCLGAGHECWLFVYEGGNIGHGILSVAAGESHLLNVCIHPEHQGKGFGRILVEHLLGCARLRGAGCVFLEVRPSNHAACSLYHDLGFNEVGVRKDYYPAFAGREDALVLAKEFV
ncbi:MAG: ribosomal protein S18-alanine N-acetyltransferase [Pseudomonadales bacterium]